MYFFICLFERFLIIMGGMLSKPQEVLFRILLKILLMLWKLPKGLVILIRVVGLVALFCAENSVSFEFVNLRFPKSDFILSADVSTSSFRRIPWLRSLGEFIAS